MDLVSIKQLLQSNEMEAVLAPQSADIFNIFCQKDGEYINTIQAIEDENDNGRQSILPLAHRLLERAVSSHRLQHQPDHHILIYDGAAETVSKSQY